MHLRSVTAIPFLLSLISLTVSVSAQTPLERMQRLTATTSLFREGIHPWHLRLSYDLYDLDGKKNESGTIEEWWASSKTFRVVVSSPSFQRSFGTFGEMSNPERGMRQLYLTSQLLGDMTHPVPVFASFTSINVNQELQMHNGLELSCLSVARASDPDQRPVNGNFLCIDPNNHMLRIRLNDRESESVLRNNITRVLDTNVAFDDTITYNGKMAITGHIDVLEPYDPPASETPTSPDAEPEAKAHPISSSPARIVKKTAPIYPESAKLGRIGGVVLLQALITKDGNVDSLEVIAAPSRDLADSAVAAVRQWKYTPALIDGLPVVTTPVITVEFHLDTK